MRDLHANISVRRCIDPQSQAGNIALTGQIIDRIGGPGGPFEMLEFLIVAGAIGTGAATFTASLVHGDTANLADGVAITDPSSLVLGTLAGASFTGASPNSTWRLGYVGGKRYCQLTLTIAANASAALVAALAVLSAPAVVPTP